MDNQIFSEAIDLFTKLGGFAGLWSAWRIYRDGIPQVRSEVWEQFYNDKKDGRMGLILTFYPGSRPLTIRSIELPDFDISIVTPEPKPDVGDKSLLGSGNLTFSTGTLRVDWRIPAASEDPVPLSVALIISRFNLNSMDAISLRIKLRTNSIPWVIRHDKFHKMKP